ncbi:MAG: T9SS type A sorting domain-containing protein [Bacteroidales bacterium]|nr:T9SS type A sorting domain-containing protein [Bacteroidales bacterium]
MRTIILILALIFSLRLFSQISVCGSSIELTADTMGTNAVTGMWTCSHNQIVISNIDPSPLHFKVIADASGIPNFFVNGMQSVWFYWEYMDHQNNLHRDSINVLFYEMPNCHHYTDTTICNHSLYLIGHTSISNALVNWGGIGSNPSNVIFSNSNESSTNAFFPLTGNYSVVWTEMNAENNACRCSDTFMVNIVNIPYIEVGPDLMICNSHFAYLCAHTDSNVIGEWSGPIGITFYDGPHDSLLNPNGKNNKCTWIKNNNFNETITMYYITFNGYCYNYDSVNVSFYFSYPPIITTNLADTVSSYNEYQSLCAVTPTYGYGYWIDNNAGTLFQPSNNTPCNVTAVVNNSGMHCFNWVTVNHTCRDTSEAFCVNFTSMEFVENIKDLYIYPNLFNEYIFIIAPKAMIVSLEGYDVLGKNRFLINDIRLELGENKVPIINNLEEGIYLIVIRYGSQKVSFKTYYKH